MQCEKPLSGSMMCWFSRGGVTICKVIEVPFIPLSVTLSANMIDSICSETYPTVFLFRPVL